MTISLFDVQAGFGGADPGQSDIISAEQLIASMDRLSIDKAMVRIAPSGLDKDVPLSNETLLDNCARHDGRLVPCPIVVPAGAYGYSSEQAQVGEAIERGAGAACIRPGRDEWSLADWVVGPLMREMSDRKLPLFCLVEWVALEQIAGLAERHPELVIIIAGIGYRSANTLLPLMRTFPNTYLSIGRRYTTHRGIEALVERLGPERLLFGSGTPAAEPMMAVAQLMYADISDHAKRRIGGENLLGLLERIRR